jgi:hypothetical protein
MFKRRHQFKYKARTKSNPTGIIGGDNMYMNDINKQNWCRIQNLMHRSENSSGQNKDDDNSFHSHALTVSDDSGSAGKIDPVCPKDDEKNPQIMDITISDAAAQESEPELQKENEISSQNSQSISKSITAELSMIE